MALCVDVLHTNCRDYSPGFTPSLNAGLSGENAPAENVRQALSDVCPPPRPLPVSTRVFSVLNQWGMPSTPPSVIFLPYPNVYK